MQLPHATLVLVADGQKYLMLRNQGDEDILDLRIIAVDEIENPPDREQSTDRPGRFPDTGDHKSAVQETDWHQLEKERFAQDVAKMLNASAMSGQLSPLVIIADPSTLGELRPSLHKATQERVLAEIDKDITNHPLDQIEDVIRKV